MVNFAGTILDWFSGMGQNCGSVVYRNTTLPDLNAQGSVTLEDLTVTGKVAVQGSLSILRGILNNLTASGNVEITDSQVQGSTTVQGEIKAVNTRFLGNIDLSTNESHFIRSQATLIEVRPSSNRREQTLFLSDESSVQRIVFQAGRGKVILQNGSRVEQIEGGDVVQQ